jgi:hypothetical protein
MQLSNRPGFALPVAIGSMVIISTLIAGVFFVSTQENRLGRNTVVQETAFRAAEAGLNNSIGTWRNAQFGSMANGAVVIQIYDSLANQNWIDTVKILRLNTQTYALVSTANASAGTVLSRHRTGAVVRIVFPSINVLGALSVRGAITVGGTSYINGNDSIPSGWTGCPTQANMPGIATPNRSNVTISGCSRQSLICVDGSPQDIKTTTSANDTTNYFNYGPDANWASVTGLADFKFTGSQTLNGMAPAVVNGVCNTASNMNWGDPSRASPAGACESFFPIVYFQGTTESVHLTTGRGQGIMLVDGDLVVDGGFEWYGPVIVRGHITTQGTGGHFFGAVMAADVNLEQNTVLGDALIQYSSCSVSNALVGSGTAKRLAQRAWTDIF